MSDSNPCRHGWRTSHVFGTPCFKCIAEEREAFAAERELQAMLAIAKSTGPRLTLIQGGKP